MHRAALKASDALHELVIQNDDVHPLLNEKKQACVQLHVNSQDIAWSIAFS